MIFDLAGRGFDLTSAKDGVRFDLDRNVSPERLAWSAPLSNVAFLVLDRNENGRIDDGGELFGSVTEQPPIEKVNGFNALAVFDADGDHAITPHDPIFASLRLWEDANHDGVAQPGELVALPDSPILSIGLDYQEARRTDRWGNRFRYRARVKVKEGSGAAPVAWDVFLNALP